MLVIGSRALVHNNPELAATRVCGDWDFIATIDQFNKWYKANKSEMAFAVPTDGGKYYHCRGKDGMNYEFEIAWEGTSALMLLEGYADAGPDVDTDYIYALNYDLLAVKMSHRYKKNSVHFKKCMDDIRLLRTMIENYEAELSSPFLRDFIALREKETYTYSHPALNVDKGSFFKDDGVQYVYDHDSIHLTVALTEDTHPYHCSYSWLVPAYTFYADGEVWSSREKFFQCSEQVRLYGVYEETCVLALERSQIPHALGKEGGPTPRWSFEMALMKVCTSITSGFFREYAWENYQKVLDLYESLGEDDYLKRFEKNQHLLKPYVKGEV